MVANYSDTTLLGSEYLALVLYSDGDNEAFRAFGLGSASAIGGGITFDDDMIASSAATVGAWTAPEPTSGLLLPLALAGLALKRKRA